MDSAVDTKISDVDSCVVVVLETGLWFKLGRLCLLVSCAKEHMVGETRLFKQLEQFHPSMVRWWRRVAKGLREHEAVFLKAEV